VKILVKTPKSSAVDDMLYFYALAFWQRNGGIAEHHLQSDCSDSAPASIELDGQCAIEGLSPPWPPDILDDIDLAAFERYSSAGKRPRRRDPPACLD
jgi:hypothetical protein